MDQHQRPPGQPPPGLPFQQQQAPLTRPPGPPPHGAPTAFQQSQPAFRGPAGGPLPRGPPSGLPPGTAPVGPGSLPGPGAFQQPMFRGSPQRPPPAYQQPQGPPAPGPPAGVPQAPPPQFRPPPASQPSQQPSHWAPPGGPPGVGPTQPPQPTASIAGTPGMPGAAPGPLGGGPPRAGPPFGGTPLAPHPGGPPPPPPGTALPLRGPPTFGSAPGVPGGPGAQGPGFGGASGFAPPPPPPIGAGGGVGAPPVPPPQLGGPAPLPGVPGVSRPSQLSPPPPPLGGAAGAPFGAAPQQPQYGGAPQQQQYAAAPQQAQGRAPAQGQTGYPPPAGVPGAGSGDAGRTGTGSLVEEFQSLTLSLAPGSAEAAVDPSALPRPQGPEWASQNPTPCYATNAHPRFFRLTTSAIPDTEALRGRWHLPLGAVVHPLAPTPPEETVPVVDFGRCGIVRCRRCRTYVNPYVSFMDAGRRWRCNVCSLLNEVPNDYFCSIDSTGRRTDRDVRPELRGGSVEYVAPAEYMVRAPMPPTYVFLLDVSYPNAQSGVLQVLCDSIKASLDKLPGDDRTRVAFLAFDSALYYFCLRSSLTQPHLYVVPDLEPNENGEPFLPMPVDELIVNLHLSRGVIDALLDSLPQMFSKAPSVECALGPALKATFHIMSHWGGKLLLFQSSLPSLGPGQLRLRGNDPKVYGTDREHALRVAAEGFYKTMAADFSRQQICVNVYSCPSTGNYCDLASIGCLARYTGGQVCYYPGFTLQMDGDRLRRDICRDLTRETAWEAVMRIRCGKGLKVATFHGHFFIRSSDLLALPAVDADKAFAIQVSHEESVLANQTTTYMQCALLYTSSSGERRIRVHTVAVPVVRDITELFRRADSEALATVLAKITLDKILTSRLEDAKQLVQQKLVLALKEYRSLFSALLNRPFAAGAPPHVAGGTLGPYGAPAQRLIFPPTLALLPLLCLGLIKSPFLKGGFQDLTADARSWAAFAATVAGVEQTLRMLHPLLLRVDTMPAECGVAATPQAPLKLPPALPPSASSLDASGVFLLDDGLSITVWIGASVNPKLMDSLFGPHVSQSADLAQVPFIQQQSPESQRLATVIDALQVQQVYGASRCEGVQYSKPVRMQKQGSPRDISFFSTLIEDRSALGSSYPEFISYLFRQVQMK